MQGLELRTLSGELLERSIDVLGQMRIDAFREFPYLYDGTTEKERRNLRHFAGAPKALIAAAYVKGVFAGIATGAPLPKEIACSLSPDEYFYIGEAIVYPEFQSKGIGSALIRHVESQARERGFEKTCFLCVERAQNHPLRPKDYREPDPIWKKLGYRKSEIRIVFEWDAFETDGFVNKQSHVMVFWTKG